MIGNRGQTARIAIPSSISHHGVPVAQDRQVVFSHSMLRMSYSYVRIGSLGEVHLAQCPLELPRGRRAIARTTRGIELAEILRHLPDSGPNQSSGPELTSTTRREPTVAILRATTQEDELLIRRLERHKREAMEACRTALAESASQTVLLDVDQLFDGGTLIMHFLGPVDDLAESITQKIAEHYEAIVRSRHFSKLLRDGCGPDCGEKEGGCGSQCSGCAVVSACRQHQP